MPKLIDEAVLTAHAVLSNEENDVLLETAVGPLGNPSGVFIRLDNVKLFPVRIPHQSQDDLVPSSPIKLGTKSTLKGKKLVIDSFVVDEVDNATDETFMLIRLTGLISSFEFALRQKASTNGGMVTYRIEIKFF
jgi:hypothetical protein